MEQTQMMGDPRFRGSGRSSGSKKHATRWRTTHVGKLAEIAKYANLCVNTPPQGHAAMNGPEFYGDQRERIDDLEKTMPTNGGGRIATVTLNKIDAP